jgi:hypothetical protein
VLEAKVGLKSNTLLEMLKNNVSTKHIARAAAE